MDISLKQLKLLKRIKRKKPVIRTDKNNIEDIEYLRSGGLVQVTEYDDPEDYYYQPRITEKGKAFLYTTVHTNCKANAALILSVIAIVLSVLTAFTPFPEMAKTFIESLLSSRP